jgi:hypothetical protein
MMRACSGCTLCCRLLPMKKDKDRELPRTINLAIAGGFLTPLDALRMKHDFDKPAGERCMFQRHKGCAIYEHRPFGCRMWNCRWLLNDDTADLSRPDRSHYVIDIAPDYVTDTDSGETIPVIQVWVDPKYPEAWKDDALLAFLDRRGKEGYAALIRYSGLDAQAVFPPSMTGEGWVIKPRQMAHEHEHTAEEKVRALGPMKVRIEHDN